MAEERYRAAELFARFLARRDAGAAEPFEELVRAHPEDAAELARLAEDWARFEPLLARLRPPAEVGGGPAPREGRALHARLSERPSPAARYRIGAELGRGGMGLVLSAWDPDLRRELAFKRLRADEGADRPRRVERFLEEAQIAAQLHHPGIAPVHEVGLEPDGTPYYTMPRLEGETLERVFERVHRGEPGWTRTRALALVLRVCEAMAYAHARGIVHRDLKPGNVMVGRYGEVTVLDWGLARALRGPEDGPGAPADDLARAPLVSGISGTPAFMAPEQARAGGALDPRSDVYALGAVLYALVAGAVPHAAALEGVTDLAQLERVHALAPRPLHELADVAPELESIVERAMAREPERRYASMQALADDLRAHLEGRAVRAHATGARVELQKWIGRNRAFAGVLLGLFVSLAVGLTASVVLYLRAQANEARVLRLADQKRLGDLVARAEILWPALPAEVPALAAWLEEAGTLVRRLPGHEATLAELRRAAVHDGDEWHLAGTEAQWQHDALSELVRDLGAFAAPGTGTVADVERRLAFAGTVEERSLTGTAARAAWDAAVRSIGDARACPAYAGLALRPQLGLLPLGRDPDSGLWEFAHLASGAPAERDADGRARLSEGSGVVLVLLPGGTFSMGAQASTPSEPNYAADAFANEAPVHAVTLAPFFLAKHELTQAQWQRATGANPSSHAPGKDGLEQPVSLLHPLETVARGHGARVLATLALSLPTEAQWEYAARGGTDTPWWTGAEARSLQDAANLADQSVLRLGGQWPQIEAWLDDGFYRHAPVDALAPNPFGLHHVHGNVWEWCADDFGSYELPVRAGDGLRLVPQPGLAVGRGGGYVNDAAFSRSAVRDARPDAAHQLYGLRPARALDP